MSPVPKRLSKRSSVWESTFNLPNYTRPQGWAVVDPGKQIEADPEELADIVTSMLADEFGGMTLDPADMDDCLDFIVRMSSGYGLSYNKVKRIIGMWLSGYYKQPQNQYDEGYQTLSTN